jgi:hypothetical protein
VSAKEYIFTTNYEIILATQTVFEYNVKLGKSDEQTTFKKDLRSRRLNNKY